MQANDDNLSTKAERRDKKHKPPMPVHGKSLKRSSPFAGLAAGRRQHLTKKKR